MENVKIEDKLRSIKDLVKTLEKKTIEMITLTAELEYRFKNSCIAGNPSFKAELEMTLLEKEIDLIMKNSELFTRNNTFLKGS